MIGKQILLASFLLVPGSMLGMKKGLKKIKRNLSKTFKKKKKNDDCVFEVALKPHAGAKIAKRIPGIKQAHRARLEAQGHHLIKKLIPHMTAGTLCLTAFVVLMSSDYPIFSLLPLSVLVILVSHAIPTLRKLIKVGVDLDEVS